MALLKENINNLIADDLDKRNQNWETIEDSLELKADKTYVDAELELKADKTDLTGGSIVDLGTFNDEGELISHAIMNQLPTGHYSCIMHDFPFLVLLRDWGDSYTGTFYAGELLISYAKITKDGEILELEDIHLRDLGGGSVGDGPIVDLGTVDGQEELITHVLMNQLPSGHYTFTVGFDDSPNFMLLRKWGTYYDGTVYNFLAQVFYFKVSISGEILELKDINLKDLGGDTGTGESSWGNLGRFNHISEVIGYIVMNQLASGSYVFEVPFGNNPSSGFATCIVLMALREDINKLEGTLYSADGLVYKFILNLNTGQLDYVGALFLDDIMTDVTEQFS